MKSALAINAESVVPLAVIRLRGQSVILDADLARLYGVTTKALNQAVRRNPDKFPEDFSFVVTRKELKHNRSQFVTGSQAHRDPRSLPYAFTEHGALMAATILRSPHAVKMSIFVVRAFVRMRALLMTESAWFTKLADLEKELTARLDLNEHAIAEIVRELRQLRETTPAPPRKKIGFLVRERHAPYRVNREKQA